MCDLNTFNKKRDIKVMEICKYRKQARKNRALLNYKYDTLKLRMNVIQVLIIILSTMITFLEAVSSHYEFNPVVFNIATITMSTVIAFIMAIYRFFRIEENKENIKQSLENHVFIINKLHKIIHEMANFNYVCDENNETNYSLWEKLENNFDGEIFDNYISIKEKFDTIFSFKDSIYYKQKYKRDFLELTFTNKEIELVDRYKEVKHNDFVLRLKGCMYYLFCCSEHESVNFNAFIKKAENGQLTKIPSSFRMQTHNSSDTSLPLNNDNDSRDFTYFDTEINNTNNTNNTENILNNIQLSIV
jgi:hypothetical protein